MLTHAQAMEGLAEIGPMIVADADSQIAQLGKRIVANTVAGKIGEQYLPSPGSALGL
jgi:hypothetical protein